MVPTPLLSSSSIPPPLSLSHPCTLYLTLYPQPFSFTFSFGFATSSTRPGLIRAAPDCVNVCDSTVGFQRQDPLGDANPVTPVPVWIRTHTGLVAAAAAAPATKQRTLQSTVRVPGGFGSSTLRSIVPTHHLPVSDRRDLSFRVTRGARRSVEGTLPDVRVLLEFGAKFEIESAKRARALVCVCVCVRVSVDLCSALCVCLCVCGGGGGGSRKQQYVASPSGQEIDTSEPLLRHRSDIARTPHHASPRRGSLRSRRLSSER